MIQNAVVAVAVLIAVLYAVRSLAPSAWLGRHVTATSEALRSRGWQVMARWLTAYAQTNAGCGGCGSCNTAAAASVGKGTEATAKLAPNEKPLVFRRPRQR